MERLNALGGKFHQSLDEYDRYDLIGLDKYGHNTLVEVKERFTKYKGWMMEKNKADSLLALANKAEGVENQIKLWYVVIFKNEYLVYNVYDIVRGELGKLPAPKTTSFENTNVVNKDSYFTTKKSFIFKL